MSFNSPLCGTFYLSVCFLPLSPHPSFLPLCLSLTHPSVSQVIRGFDSHFFVTSQYQRVELWMPCLAASLQSSCRAVSAGLITDIYTFILLRGMNNPERHCGRSHAVDPVIRNEWASIQCRACLIHTCYALHCVPAEPACWNFKHHVWLMILINWWDRTWKIGKALLSMGWNVINMRIGRNMYLLWIWAKIMGQSSAVINKNIYFIFCKLTSDWGFSSRHFSLKHERSLSGRKGGQKGDELRDWGVKNGATARSAGHTRHGISDLLLGEKPHIIRLNYFLVYYKGPLKSHSKGCLK